MTRPDSEPRGSAQSEPPPYRPAILAGLAVLTGYVLTLAPTVTFWDAGEFIAAAKILGIPHPPGTPLFVLVAHVWALLFPVGEFAWRLNLLSALMSAAGATCWFLVAHESLGSFPALPPSTGRRIRLAGAAAAALLSAFSFTNWQNSNETEVYAVSTFLIAAVAWLGLRWRATRGTVRGARWLLLAIYLLGVSLGNHLLALLAGPGFLLFLSVELRARPASEPSVRRADWARTVVIGAIWSTLVAVGLGSIGLLAAGGTLLAIALVVAARARALPFAMAAMLFASVGVTPYFYLLLRSRHQPVVNEAAPATFDALLDVIRRQQYPPRTPLDDPTELSGGGNPGRTPALLVLQSANYLQYFDWQWARGLAGELPGRLPVHTLVTLLMASLGLRGLMRQRATDRSAWWLSMGIFLVTGLGLVLYMNFKPGYSLGYDRYPSASDHEVRERDYFFVVSFIVWGVWAGMGLARVAATIAERVRRAAPAGLVFGLAFVPLALNWSAATRRGPDARLAADFAYDLLNSVPPYGVLFTYGDNDTFPLWWAQEVEGIRRDVTVVCLALAETEWNMRQLRDNPVRRFEPARAPAVWRDSVAAPPDWPLHSMTDDEIRAAQPQALRSPARIRFGERYVDLPAGTVLYGKDFLTIRLLQQNLGRRSIAWGLGAADTYYGLEHLAVQQGLVVQLRAAEPDSADARYDMRRMLGVPLDVPLTAQLTGETYRYGGLLEGRAGALDPTARIMASTLAFPNTQLARAYLARGDTTSAIRFLLRAGRLSASPSLTEEAARLQSGHPSHRP